MKKCLAAAAALVLTALAFSPLHAQEKVAVWTVPAPQTLEVRVIVSPPGLGTFGQPIERSVVIDNVPAGSVVTVTQGPAASAVAVADPFCDCLKTGVCYCQICNCSPATQAAPQGYRMQCDGKSCRMVPIVPPAPGSAEPGSYGDAQAIDGTRQRGQFIRRIIQRIRHPFGGRFRGGRGGCAGCG